MRDKEGHMFNGKTIPLYLIYTKTWDSFTYLHQVPGPRQTYNLHTNPVLFYLVNIGIKERLLLPKPSSPAVTHDERTALKPSVP